jgi:hypothetical protein
MRNKLCFVLAVTLVVVPASPAVTQEPALPPAASNAATPATLAPSRLPATGPPAPADKSSDSPSSEPWQPPLSQQEIEMRESIRTLGKHRGRYIQCHLQGGRQVTGTIKSIGDRTFTLGTAAFDQEKLFYWQLTAPPRRVRAVRLRSANVAESGLIIGVIGVGVVLFFILITATAGHI